MHACPRCVQDVRTAALCSCATAQPTAVLSTVPTLSLPFHSTPAAQVFEGGDFACPGSAIPDRCAFENVVDAINICSSMSTCRSVLQYHNGTDGCSDPVAVLSTSWPTETNSYVAPTVDVLNKNSDKTVRLVPVWGLLFGGWTWWQF